MTTQIERTDENRAGTVPALAPGVELLGEMPGSGYRQAPSLVRRGDGQTLQLTPLLYGVLEALDGARGYPEIAERLSEKIGKTASAEDVQFLLEKKLKPLGVLAGADGAAPVAPKSNPLLALRPRVVISNPEVTKRVTGPFSRLFAPYLVLPGLAAFLVATGWVLFVRGLGRAAHQAFYQPGLLLAVFGLTVVSAGFHEFGHAAACRRGGAVPGTMGFGLYIVWPAFYTDVSDSYRLSRWRRLWVDLGGLYFNALFCLMAFGLWAITSWDALLLVMGTQVLQMLRQLTPVIRADGYHILADLTGVPDLFAHLKPTIQSLWPGNWGKRDTRTLKRWARVLVIAWVVLIVPSLVFALVSGAVVLPRLIATAWDSLGVQAHGFATAADRGDIALLFVYFLKMIAVVLPVAGTILMLGRLVLRTVKGSWAKTADHPRRRAGLLAVALAVVLALGFAWWPRQQYQPIAANARGTLGELPSLLRQASTGTVVPASVVRPSAVRMPALLLVPRPDGGAVRPALVVLRPPDGGPTKVIAIGAVGGPPGGNPWPFPFPPPDAPRPGDSRAITINTTDGSAVYDTAFSMVFVTNGQDVRGANEAIALADCSHCRTVSVAFQAVFLVGQSNIVAPINTSQSLNYHCLDCHTTAIAAQLVVSLTALPDPSTMAQLDTLWRQLDQLTADLPKLSDAEIVARLNGLQADILRTLDAAAPVASTTAATAAANDPVATASPTPAASSSPTDGSTAPADPATPSPTPAAPTPSADPSSAAPSEPASPAPSSSPGAAGAVAPSAPTG